MSFYGLGRQVKLTAVPSNILILYYFMELNVWSISNEMIIYIEPIRVSYRAPEKILYETLMLNSRILQVGVFIGS